MKAKTRGQALVETALVIGLVVLLIIGGIQFLYAFYTVRNVRAAAEEAVNTAAVYGGDTAEFQKHLPDILQTYHLVPTRTTVIVDPPQGRFLEPLTVTVVYSETVRIYGLFALPIPPQKARALSQKDADGGW